MNEPGTIEDLELHFAATTPFSRAKHGFKWVNERETVIAGFPLDITSTYRPGCRFGPREIREASHNLEPASIRLNTTVEGAAYTDLGDLEIFSLDMVTALKLIRTVTIPIREHGNTLIALGGEHSITASLVPREKDVGIIVLDAHLDLRDNYMGSTHSHACINRRLIEFCGDNNILILGWRACCREEINFLKEHRINNIPSSWFKNSKAREKAFSSLSNFMDSHDGIYLSVDMDVFDPAYAPGVANPEPGGLTPLVVLDILANMKGQNLVGADIVEVSPAHDHGQAAMLAARIAMEILNLKQGIPLF
ncbi:agmatinase [Candidatus Bathyarchaeota archaeon]|nr:agmatinase [Candidatus Bathyarchaeota archaeon]